MRFSFGGAIGRRLATTALVVLATLVPASGAAGAVAPGGLGAPADVALADVTCVARCVDTHKATPGAKVRVRGVAMDRVRQVAFRGERGPLLAKPLRSNERAAMARVPKGALTGRPFVIDETGRRSPRSPHKLHVLPATAIPESAFPVRGRYQLWDGFGAGRNHQGADLGAPCGTPLVAALAGTVTKRATEGAAGHHVVIRAQGVNADLAYLHLARPALVRPGQQVGAGQLVGYVGDSGNASGCHLHFEYWRGRFWRGGSPVDPLPYLREWGLRARTSRR